MKGAVKEGNLFKEYEGSLKAALSMSRMISGLRPLQITCELCLMLITETELFAFSQTSEMTTVSSVRFLYRSILLHRPSEP